MDSSSSQDTRFDSVPSAAAPREAAFAPGTLRRRTARGLLGACLLSLVGLVALAIWGFCNVLGRQSVFSVGELD